MSDDEFMIEEGIHPFYYRDEKGVLCEYEGGINPSYVEGYKEDDEEHNV